MSAAANAAGYLYARGQLAAQGDAEPEQVQVKPVEPARTPKIQYRKRRSYSLPLAAMAASSSTA